MARAAEAGAAGRSLPRGRHSLTREEVAGAQRLRLAVAMADAMAEHGYVGTPVASVLERAGVSRETFYRLYDGKLACYLDALDLVEDVLAAGLDAIPAHPGTPLDRAERAVGSYLDLLVEHRSFARLVLVESHAAGPEALERRTRLQRRVAEGLADLLGVDGSEGAFACKAYVAAIASLVALPIVTGDDVALRALHRPLIDHLRLLASALDLPA